MTQQEEIEALRRLIQDVIQTLNGRDDSVKEWIEEQLDEINAQ